MSYSKWVTVPPDVAKMHPLYGNGGWAFVIGWSLAGGIFFDGVQVGNSIYAGAPSLEALIDLLIYIGLFLAFLKKWKIFVSIFIGLAVLNLCLSGFLFLSETRKYIENTDKYLPHILDGGFKREAQRLI
jgi:hypothetical protein